MLQDDDTALDKKLSVAGAIARHPSADLIADDLATLARAMVTSETDPLHFEFGVRVLNRVSTDDVLPHIERGLTHEDLRFRRAAAASLKDGALPRALPLVVELTAHPETRVRKRAVQALEHYLDTPRGRAALLDNLDNETDSEVCTRAIETLAFDGPSAAAALVERLDPDTPGCGPEHGFVVLASVRRALREHPLTPQVDDALREVAANHPDPGMRGYAAAALGDLELAKSLGGVASYDGLSLMTSRSLESLDTRLGAIAALGELDVTGSAERLEGLLGNIDAEPEQLMAVMDVLENTGKADPAKTFLAFPYTSSLEEPALRQRALAFMKRTSSFPARAEPEGHDEKVHDH